MSLIICKHCTHYVKSTCLNKYISCISAFQYSKNIWLLGSFCLLSVLAVSKSAKTLHYTTLMLSNTSFFVLLKFQLAYFEIVYLTVNHSDVFRPILS